MESGFGQPPRPEGWEAHRSEFDSAEARKEHERKYGTPEPYEYELEEEQAEKAWGSPRQYERRGAKEPLTTERLQQENPKDEDDLGGFPPETKHAVNGLIYLGHLEDRWSAFGHHFHIKTLRGDEELMVYRLAQMYSDIPGGWSRAIAWAHTALCLVSVDRDENFCPPLGPINDKFEYAQARWNYVTEKWYYPTARMIFQRYTELMERQADAIETVQNLSERGRTPSTPSPDSSTDQGTSESQTETEISKYLDS